MQMSQRKRLLPIVAALLLLGTSRLGAVLFYSTDDPAYNTQPPTGSLTNSGWQWQGLWGGVLGTAIAPHYFIAA
jgi:prolipoprotein diacylglyceryltransferase